MRESPHGPFWWISESRNRKSWIWLVSKLKKAPKFTPWPPKTSNRHCFNPPYMTLDVYVTSGTNAHANRLLNSDNDNFDGSRKVFALYSAPESYARQLSNGVQYNKLSVKRNERFLSCSAQWFKALSYIMLIYLHGWYEVRENPLTYFQSLFIAFVLKLRVTEATSNIPYNGLCGHDLFVSHYFQFTSFQRIARLHLLLGRYII